MKAFYNENDPKAAAWLRELIKAGLIANGDVDERSITDLNAQDLYGYTQCHFFAGIGGWSYALRLAGWPDDQPVWTGSCPCQPFSAAGKRLGESDKRHLWPDFKRLIANRLPATVFGEQVASKDGRLWLSRVRADLEAMGYGVGAADLCAAGVSAPHQRQRLYWVADAKYAQWRTLSHPCGSQGRDLLPQREKGAGRIGGGCETPSGLGHTEAAGLQGQWGEYRPSGERCSGLVGLAVQVGVPSWNGPTVAVECSDGSRRVSAQPNAFPLAHGVPARMVKLRGSGNAIVPQLAAEFIQASVEALSL